MPPGKRPTLVISIWTGGLTEGVSLTDVSRSVLYLDARDDVSFRVPFVASLDVRDIGFGAKEDEEVESNLTCWANLRTAGVLISQ